MSEINLILGGRQFQSCTEATTFEQDLRLSAILYEAGLVGVEKGKDETEGAYAQRVYAVMLNGARPRLLEMIGCCIVPCEGTLGRDDWTPEVAAKTTEFCAALTEKKDKELLRDISMELLASFLNAGNESKVLSPNSFDHAGNPSDLSADRHAKENGTSADASQGTGTSASGMPSSGNWPGIIPLISRRFKGSRWLRALHSTKSA